MGRGQSKIAGKITAAKIAAARLLQSLMAPPRR
jgi:hypothetical protein